MCLVYNISAIRNPSAEVFEQFAATDFARTIAHDHLRSPTITHDLCDQSCDPSTIFPRFQHF